MFHLNQALYFCKFRRGVRRSFLHFFVFGKGDEDSINIPREPSLSPYMMTSTFNNNNNSKKREEENLLNVNTNKEEPREDSHDIEEYSLSRHNLLIDNEDDYVINNNTDYDDSINIDNNYDYLAM